MAQVKFKNGKIKNVSVVEAQRLEANGEAIILDKGFYKTRKGAKSYKKR